MKSIKEIVYWSILKKKEQRKSLLVVEKLPVCQCKNKNRKKIRVIDRLKFSMGGVFYTCVWFEIYIYSQPTAAQAYNKELKFTLVIVQNYNFLGEFIYFFLNTRYLVFIVNY